MASTFFFGNFLVKRLTSSTTGKPPTMAMAPLGDALPIKPQQERSQKRACERSPADTHELSDERRRIQGYEHRNNDEEHDEHTHDNDLAALSLLRHLVVNRAADHLVGARALVAVDDVERHGG